MNKNKFLRIVATLIITIIGTMGMVYAATQIYNTYIKKDDNIDLRGLYKVSDGWYSDEISAGMNYDKKSNMYYKIIAEEDTYKEYEEKVSELPRSTEIEFDNNFFMLITHGEVSVSNLYEKDLTISEITADETTTYISLKPKENPDYNKLRSSLYVIADKTLLRDNIIIEIDTSSFILKNNTPINELSANYSKEDAIKDGCMIVEGVKNSETNNIEGKVTSENKYALEELIENSKNGIESYVRLYIRRNKQVIEIYDIQYKNSIFIINSGILGDVDSFEIITCKYIAKMQMNDGSYLYQASNNGYEDYYGRGLFTIKYDR